MTTSFKGLVGAGVIGAIVALAGAYGALQVGWISAASGRSIHDYLLAHPEVLVEAQNRLQAQQDASDDAARQAAVNKQGVKEFFDPRVAFSTGPANAKTTIVEFFDYNCPYCRASVPALKAFYQSHKNARYAFIEFPIKGARSTFAARAAMAARRQPAKYLAFHFALMSEEGMVDQSVVYADALKVGLDVNKLKADMASPDVDAALAASHKLAQQIGIDGTPAFIINGRVREGAVDDSLLKQMTSD